VRGRKKNRAEKYDPDMDIGELRERAWKGQFHGEPVWQHIMEIWEVSEYDWEKLAAFNFYEQHPEACPKNMILEWCRILLETKNIEGFQRLADMMRAAVELKTRGVSAVDPLRSAIVQGNEVLYQKVFKATKYVGDVKKGELLKYLRSEHRHVFQDLEDPDIFKMMRNMGLPRRPYCFTEDNQRVMDNFMKGYKKRWKKKS